MLLTKRQKEIIETAIDIIATDGIQKLTTKHIAECIGISEPAIYRHFKNKFEILETLLDFFEYTSSDFLKQTSMANQSSFKQIEMFIFDRYKIFSSDPNFTKVMFSEECFQGTLSDKILSIMHKHKDKMLNLIIMAQKDGDIRDDIDPKSLFRIIFGAVRLLIKQWCLSGFKFSLEAEGCQLWESQKKLLKRS